MMQRRRNRSPLVIALIMVPAVVYPQAGAPEHMVAFMTAAGQTQCPDGWAEAGYAQGRLILGTTEPSDVAKAFGEPTQDAKAPEHKHGFELTGHIDLLSQALDPVGGSLQRASDGEVKASGTTHPFVPSLPFIQFLVCENQTNPEVDSTPFGTFAYFNAKACPADWAASEQAHGRFALVAPADGKPGTLVGAAWDPAQPPTHTHDLSSSFVVRHQTLTNWPSGSTGNTGAPGTYPLAGTAHPAGPLLPLVSLLACERSSGFGNGDGVPCGTAIFFGGEVCPDGWGDTIGADGRFVIGIGGNGTQGATIGTHPIDGSSPISIHHDHGFGGSVGVPAYTQAPGSYRSGMASSPNWGAAGGAGFGGTTSDATQASEVPVLVLQSCTRECSTSP